MRLVTYEVDGAFRAGILLEQMVVDAAAATQAAGLVAAGASPHWISPRQVFCLGTEEFRRLDAAVHMLAATEETSGQVKPLAEGRLAPPLPHPQEIIFLCPNVHEHAAQAHLVS